MKQSTIFHTRVIAGRRKASFSCTHKQKIICSQTLPSICYFYKKYVFLVSSLSRFSGSRLQPLGLQGWEMFAQAIRLTSPVCHKGLSTYFFNKILLNVMLQHLWKFVIKALFFLFPIQLYWTCTRTVNIHKRQSATKRELQLEAEKQET